MNVSTAPLIGIPCRHDKSVIYRQSAVNAQNESYLQAISKVGGIPFLIPLNLDTPALRKLYTLADGILLAGGGDVNPALFGAKPFGNESDPQYDRDDMEILISRWAMEDKKPILGICRGIQILAVSVGGDIIQDLPQQMPEATDHNYVYLADDNHTIEDIVHDVKLKRDSRLQRVLQSGSLSVNSMHHQAVKSVPAPMEVTGVSTDGVIEAIELPVHPFFVGIQWHPEVLVDKFDWAWILMQAFVDACR